MNNTQLKTDELVVCNQVDNINFYFNVLGLKPNHTIEDFDAAVRVHNKHKLIAAWSSKIENLKKSNPSLSYEEVRQMLSEDVVQFMGWTSFNNLSSYLNEKTDKYPGEKVLIRLSDFLSCNHADLSIITNNNLLIKHRERLLSQNDADYDKKRKVIGNNLREQWLKYKSINDCTQAQFCTQFLNGMVQSNFSGMIKGRISPSKERIIEFSKIFNCSPVDIDPDFEIMEKSMMCKLIDILESKSLFESEKRIIEEAKSLL